MRMLLAACGMVVLKVGTWNSARLILIGKQRSSMVMLNHRTRVLVTHGHVIAHVMREPALHGNGRERLNRKAQHKQHDDEEFAPVRHGYGV